MSTPAERRGNLRAAVEQRRQALRQAEEDFARQHPPPSPNAATPARLRLYQESRERALKTHRAALARANRALAEHDAAHGSLL